MEVVHLRHVLLLHPVVPHDVEQRLAVDAVKGARRVELADVEHLAALQRPRSKKGREPLITSESSPPPPPKMSQHLKIAQSACERAVGAKPGSEHIVARLKAIDKDGNGEVRKEGAQ